jgi:predicted nucleic acid-binding protein
LQVGGATITDAHIAACAMENAAVLYMADRDFARFSGLKFTNPLDANRG